MSRASWACAATGSGVITINLPTQDARHETQALLDTHVIQEGVLTPIERTNTAPAAKEHDAGAAELPVSEVLHTQTHTHDCTHLPSSAAPPVAFDAMRFALTFLALTLENGSRVSLQAELVFVTVLSK